MTPPDWATTDSPPPIYTSSYQILKYFLRIRNLIDLSAILPYYIQLYVGKSLSGGIFVRVIRLFRLVRILRLLKALTFFKNVDVTLDLINTTIQNSSQVLIVFLFFVMIVIILVACVMYLCEQGDFTVNDEYPNGAYLRVTIHNEIEVSPFNSIPTCIYWSILSAGTYLQSRSSTYS